MPGPFVQVGATIMCPHGGRVSIISRNLRVKGSKQSLALLTDVSVVTGCPFQVPVGPAMKPQPCVTVRWLVGSLRARAQRQPVLIRTSTGICFSAEQIPQGPPVIVMTQMRARGQ